MKRLSRNRWRSIPAWAGKPVMPSPDRWRLAVHPRVGGETTEGASRSTAIEGPSPRGRGNRDDSDRVRRRSGSIPAWAGKPRQGLSCRARGQVHPRVGGETPDLWFRVIHDTGPSPRGRGNHPAQNDGGRSGRSIPAWAGKPTTRPRRMVTRRVHPRVGGETAQKELNLRVDEGPSPRGRGNLRPVDHQHPAGGSIPAWAGKPAGRERVGRSAEVHPRVGGETSASI